MLHVNTGHAVDEPMKNTVPPIAHLFTPLESRVNVIDSTKGNLNFHGFNMFGKNMFDSNAAMQTLRFFA